MSVHRGNQMIRNFIGTRTRTQSMWVHTPAFRKEAIPLQAWIGPEGSKRLRLLELLDNQHMKVVRLLDLRTSRI
jgi:hypothetical protein